MKAASVFAAASVCCLSIVIVVHCASAIEPADETQSYFRDGFAGQVRDFAAAIAGEAPLRVSGWDGLAAVEMVEAAENSSATGLAVPLPLDAGDRRQA